MERGEGDMHLFMKGLNLIYLVQCGVDKLQTNVTFKQAEKNCGRER